MSVAHHLPIPVLVCTVAAGLGAQGHHGLDPANLDTTCAPCQDFYRYSNGGWLARTTLGAEYASYGGFTELIERNNETLRGIVDRKSTRLNSSHSQISYAVFCLKKKKEQQTRTRRSRN